MVLYTVAGFAVSSGCITHSQWSISDRPASVKVTTGFRRLDLFCCCLNVVVAVVCSLHLGSVYPKVSSNCVFKDDLEFSDPPASTSQVLGLQICTNTPGLFSAEDGTQHLVHVRQALYQPQQILGLERLELA